MLRFLAATGEPALLLGAVNALIVLGVSFGLPLTSGQIAAINAAAAAVIAVIIRQTVSPMQK